MESSPYQRDGKWVVPLKIACPKAEMFGGTCPNTMH